MEKLQDFSERHKPIIPVHKIEELDVICLECRHKIKKITPPGEKSYFACFEHDPKPIFYNQREVKAMCADLGEEI